MPGIVMTKKLTAARYIIVSLSLLGFFFSVTAQSAAPSSLSIAAITMNEYFQLLRQQHPIFQLGPNQLRIAKQNQKVSLGAKDWSIFYEGNIRQFQIVGINEPQIQIDQLSTHAGFRRSVWETGGRLSGQWDFRNNHLREPALNLLPYQANSRNYDNTLALQYEHPLLRNYGGGIDRTEFEANNYVVKMAAIKASEQEEDFLLSSGLAYIDWALLEEQRKILQFRIELSSRQVSQVTKKHANNLVDKIDVLRAKNSHRDAVQRLFVIDAQRESQHAKLAQLIVNHKLPSKPSFDLYQTHDFPPIAKSNRFLTEHSRTARFHSLQILEMKRRRESAADQVRNDLSIVVDASINGDGIEAGDVLGFNNHSIGIGLRFSKHLGNQAAEARLKKITFQVYDLSLRRHSALIKIQSEVSALTTQLIQMNEILGLNREQIAFAKISTAEEINLYNQGRNDFATVILSQDREQLARLDYANNAASYQQSLLQLKSRLDSIVPLVKQDAEIKLFTGEY